MTRAPRLIRLWLAASVAFGALALAPAGAGATGPDPVLLLHGYRGSESSLYELRDWLLAPEGGARSVVHTVQLPGQDNRVNAQYVKDYAAARGWTRFDVVGHSMGGLSSRWYAKFLAGTTALNSYVSLGTPQYGVNSACALPEANGGQMCPRSKFLRDLNRGDDTPGAATAYATIYSTSDEVVPYKSSRLDGGACHFQLSGLRHDDLIHSPAVTFPLVLAALDDAPDANCPTGGVWRT